VASRLLARAVPLALGAVAAGVWLHRRTQQRPQLREVTGELPPEVPPEAPPEAPRTRPPEPRFVRAARLRVPRRAIDIVTIVDDLLGSAR
jgi:hypothetical protein